MIGNLLRRALENTESTGKNERSCDLLVRFSKNKIRQRKSRGEADVGEGPENKAEGRVSQLVGKEDLNPK